MSRTNTKAHKSNELSQYSVDGIDVFYIGNDAYVEVDADMLVSLDEFNKSWRDPHAIHIDRLRTPFIQGGDL